MPNLMPLYFHKILLLLCVLLVAELGNIRLISARLIEASPLPKITIIIDDLGDNQTLGLRTARLPKNVALSILPHTPYSRQIATFGHQRGMDILLHQPMESLTRIDLLGPGALLEDMQRLEFAKILENNINAVPFVIGINNHMGSLLTTDIEKMNWLMAELKQRAIFFIDSRTTSDSIAGDIAYYWQIPTMSRRIFLDHYDDPEAIAKQFSLLLKLAKKNGHAVAIGHPRKQTLQFLEQKLPQLEALGFELVSTSEMIKGQQLAAINPSFSDRGCYQPQLRYFMDIQQLYTFESNFNCSDY